MNKLISREIRRFFEQRNGTFALGRPCADAKSTVSCSPKSIDSQTLRSGEWGVVWQRPPTAFGGVRTTNDLACLGPFMALPGVAGIRPVL